MSDHLRVADHDGVRLLTIDRPEAKNALHAAAAPRPARRAAGAPTPTPRCGSWCSPAPTRCSAPGSTSSSSSGAPTTRRAPTTTRQPSCGRMRTPVICAVNGACVSGALEIALSASFVVASDQARFADTHAALGVVPTWGLTALLPRAVGVRKASEMSATAAFVAADEALRLGLVNHVVPHADLLPFTLGLAARVPATAAVGEMLDLYRRGEELSLGRGAGRRGRPQRRPHLRPRRLHRGRARRGRPVRRCRRRWERPVTAGLLPARTATTVAGRPLSATQAATRRRLLDAARELASEGGYEAVTMRAVAERAGVSPPTAYQYFASRDHVLVGVLSDLAAGTTALVTERPSRRRDPVERTVATLRRVVQRMEDEPTLFVALLRAYLSGAPEVRALPRGDAVLDAGVGRQRAGPDRGPRPRGCGVDPRGGAARRSGEPGDGSQLAGRHR